ncbi:MAG: SufE family protein [Rhodothermales bacterium]
MSAIDDILLSFDQLDPVDRLEWLIEFGNSLPELPNALHEERDAGRYIVHECQAPVFLKAEVIEGNLHLYADAPREAAIAKGFISVLISMFDKMPTITLQEGPADMLQALKIYDLVGMQRKRGLSAIYASLRAQVLN